MAAAVRPPTRRCVNWRKGRCPHPNPLPGEGELHNKSEKAELEFGVKRGTQMNGIDPYAYLNQVSIKMDTLTQRDQIETVLDEVEYLFEVIPPELQNLVEPIIEELRKRLADCS
jgi:hypothetical protein